MFELKLPYIDPVRFASSLVDEYGFDHKQSWNATQITVPEGLGSGGFKLYIRDDIHFFRGKWNFADQTIFHSNDPVAQKGIIDFRISAGGLIQSAALEGYQKFEFDTTNIDGIRIFMHQRYLKGDKHQLQDRFNTYCYNVHIREVLNRIFALDPGQEDNSLLLESRMLEFIYFWGEYLSKKDLSPHFEEVSERQQRGIVDALSLIRSHLNKDLLTRDLSRKVGLNECDFKKAFRKITGLPLRQFIIRERMEKARELLLTTQMPLTEICYQVGYTNRSHFTALYQRYFSAAPQRT